MRRPPGSPLSPAAALCGPSGRPRRFYGDGKRWTKSAYANKDKMRDVTSIPVGTVLTIPPK